MSDGQNSIGQSQSASPASAPQPTLRADRIILLFGLAILLLGAVSQLMSLPLIQRKEDVRRFQSENNLSNIALALLNYEAANRTLPPAVVTDATGKPLYSWRVLLLKELERPDLYDRFDFTQAWDSPANAPFIMEIPDVLHSPYPDVDSKSGYTSYQALVDSTGSRTAMQRTSGRSLAKVQDGVSNTALIMENREKPVIWTKPDDTDPAKFLAQFSPEDDDGDVTVVFCDRSVRRLQEGFYEAFQGAMYADDGKVPPR